MILGRWGGRLLLLLQSSAAKSSISHGDRGFRVQAIGVTENRSMESRDLFFCLVVTTYIPYWVRDAVYALSLSLSLTGWSWCLSISILSIPPTNCVLLTEQLRFRL